MATLNENIIRNNNSWDECKEAIVEKGVDVPDGTPVEQYADKIRGMELFDQSIIDAGVAIINVEKLNTEVIDSSFDPFTSKIIDGQGIFNGNEYIKTVSCDFSSLENALGTFTQCTALMEFTSPMPNLKDGLGMFAICPSLATFNSELPSLSNGTGMFAATALSSFSIPLPEMLDGSGTFTQCPNLTSFSSLMPKLTNANTMFDGCPELVEFTSGLGSLEDGSFMFRDCPKLSVESLINILTTLPDRTGSETATITIGQTNIDKLTAEQIAVATNKNWTVE